MRGRPIETGRVVRGRIRPPGSKSIANRVLPLAAGAEGTSEISGLPDGDDVRRMLEGIAALGAVVQQVAPGSVRVTGIAGPPAGDTRIDVGASGTTMRFLAGFAATGSGATVLDGTQRMRERPIGHLADALRSLGASIDFPAVPGFPPMAVRGPIEGGRVTVDASVSSQYASAIMLAAPHARSDLEVTISDDVVSAPYLEATVEALQCFGVPVGRHETGWTVGAGSYRAQRLAVAPDASGAVYPWVGAAITSGNVLVEGLDRRTSTQADMGVLEVLERMGATVTQEPDGIRLEGPGRLQGVEADLTACPDGSLGLAIAAACAIGPSRFTGLGTLRVKETDRLDALENELRKVGVGATAGPDSLDIHPGDLRPASVATYDDHRMAMSFALLGLVTDGIVIEDPDCVSKTWPSFFTDLDAIAPPSVDVVAIDGPAGTGKTTVSKAVADALGRLRLDTGAFYRAATLVAQRTGAAVDAGLADELASHAFTYDDGVMRIDGEDVSAAIRTAEVTAGVSAVSAVAEVRARMVDAQRDWVRGSGVGVVVEGRDIGTVVFPGARTKVYLNARPDVRAARRAAEVGSDPAEEEARIRRRDELDSSRETSPLRPADDAWELDTSDLTIEQVVDAIVTRVRSS